MAMQQSIKPVLVGAILCLALSMAPTLKSGAQTPDGRYFSETKHTMRGVFWKYWQEHGALQQQGFPISEEFTEVNEADGKTYVVQYFERAVFEKHPENAPPNDVLLSLLGAFLYKQKYPSEAPQQTPNQAAGSRLFTETGKRVGGVFLAYWQGNGGLAQQGLPISEEFTETNELDGKAYTVQYFERAVFEQHPENPAPYNVLLSQLGTFGAKKKYPGGTPGGEGQPLPTSAPAQPTPQPTAQPTQQQPTTRPIGQPTAPVAQPTRTQTGTNCNPVAEARKSRVGQTGQVGIAEVQYSGEERVTLKNGGGSSADIGGWVLRDKNELEQKFVFPNGAQIPAGGTVEVYTEPGHPYTFNSRSSIWNNCGDAIELLNKSGTPVATYAYGTHLLP